MKAIIIDDEKHVREGLLLLVDWDKYKIDIVFEAEGVNEAIELIKEHRPEIIFTDMKMPQKDGISLLKWINYYGVNSKTIVISGYEDFEYMRNAIYYKSFDYLLKPIDPVILNQALGRAVDEWNEQSGKTTDASAVPDETGYPMEKSSFQQIEEYLQLNYQKDIQLRDIADSFYLSREYISRRFKQEYNETITDYLMKLRMDKAKQLLGSPQLKIAQIANQVGYQNEKYFSRVFKRMTGLTPNEYRVQFRKESKFKT